MCKPALVLLIAILTIAAATPPRPPIVTITKTDGTTVRGQLGTVDLNAVSVQLLVKGKPEGESQSIDWAEIKSLSNGITRQRVIEQWKKDHPDDHCKDCFGEGKLACPTCKGTGREVTAAKSCPTCKGELLIACNTPRCDKGKIPCPKTHIRLDQGNWVKNDDGKRWRTFPNATGGTWTISDGHIGEVFDPKTGASGQCVLCSGTFLMDDPKCRGTALRPCNVCIAAATKEKCPSCERGKVACEWCGGTGIASLAKPKPEPAPEPPTTAPAEVVPQ